MAIWSRALEALVIPAWDRWRGRRVFITGHTGFKGSWLALWLTQLGATVCGYALEPPSSPSLFEVARVAERVEDIRADIRDLARLQAAMSNFAPDVVFHLAAQSLVRRSYAEPVSTYSTNVMGTVNVLEAVRATASVRAAICITTDKCYENREWAWGYREVDRLGGRDPYSNSKACAELVCSAYRDSFFPTGALQDHVVAVATARAGNVIGGGDWAVDRLIPDLLRGFAAGESVRIRYPNAIRPWQHVLEPLRGYLMLAERMLNGEQKFGSAWNFGPNDKDAKPVEWIVAQLADLWPEAVDWFSDDQPHVYEATYLKLDCSKSHSILEWRPTLSLSNALVLIVEWARSWQSGADMQRFTLQQIAAYQESLSADLTDQ